MVALLTSPPRLPTCSRAQSARRFRLRPRPASTKKAHVTLKQQKRFPRMQERGLRYYEPALGRWMSRDPSDESSFKITHAMLIPRDMLESRKLISDSGCRAVNNNLLNNFDFLGLMQQQGDLKGCCGPEISSPLLKTMVQVANTFNNWSYFNQKSACNEIIFFATAPSAWGVDLLTSLGLLGPPVFMEPAKHGSGDCERTISYLGKCYKANAANYMLYGKMNRLCHDRLDAGFFTLSQHSLNQTLLRVALYKIGLYRGADVTQALEFTAVGFLGYKPVGIDPCKNCQIQPKNNVAEDIFVWTWKPVTKPGPNPNPTKLE